MIPPTLVIIKMSRVDDSQFIIYGTELSLLWLALRPSLQQYRMTFAHHMNLSYKFSKFIILIYQTQPPLWWLALRPSLQLSIQNLSFIRSDKYSGWFWGHWSIGAIWHRQQWYGSHWSLKIHQGECLKPFIKIIYPKALKSIYWGLEKFIVRGMVAYIHPTYRKVWSFYWDPVALFKKSDRFISH